MIALTPSFPPLLKGMAVGPANPFKIACDQARRGVDAGLVAWSIGDERMRAAIVLAPDVALEPAMAALCAIGTGFQNAMGALAPAETAVHLEWSGGLRVNGGHCGRLRLFASTTDAAARPDWLVAGIDVTLALPSDFEPGETPDWTSLADEGCAEIDHVLLLEAWARHSLLWLGDVDTPQGRAALSREYEGLVHEMGKPISFPLGRERIRGTFLGLDENFGMILKAEDGETRLIPLSRLIEED